MRVAAALIVIAILDVTPQGGSFREARWTHGDFVAASNEPLNRVDGEGDVVGIQLSGRRESCLLRRRLFLLRLPCRIRFVVRWSDARFDQAYPSVHLLFNPPDLASPWWKDPISDRDHHWRESPKSFLFHFSTDRNYRLFGITNSVEEALGRHDYSAPENKWIAVDISLEEDYAAVSVDGRHVCHAKVDLSGVRSFTYGIGDQTSTLVELDEFSFEPGR